MSLSRPVRFSLLKLPFLCIESVIKNWDIYDIIFFAAISQKTRQIVKHLEIPLNGIKIFVSERTWIDLGSSSTKWYLMPESELCLGFRSGPFYQNLRKDPLVLQKNAIPLYTSRANGVLISYTHGNTALKMVMEFLNEIFKCLPRLVKFPLLKLPFLCIECVIKKWDILDIIFFALISKRTRRIVKHLKIPLSGIRICLLEKKWIDLGRCKMWIFKKRWESLSDRNLKVPLVLEKNTISLYTSKTDYYLESYTKGDEFIAAKMVIEFLTEVFKYSVESVSINDDDIPESGNIGVKSTVTLGISQNNSQQSGYVQSQKLNLFLEHMEVTGTCHFFVTNTENSFYVDPKLFKCRNMVFWSGSGAWITRESFLQFEVPQLIFEDCPFSVEDIQSFVTHWFHSDSMKLEYLHIGFRRHVSLDEFQSEELDPIPFSERTRVAPSESFTGIDFSKGLEIVRHDGLVATIHVNGVYFLFYIWHDQSAITQN